MTSYTSRIRGAVAAGQTLAKTSFPIGPRLQAVRVRADERIRTADPFITSEAGPDHHRPPQGTSDQHSAPIRQAASAPPWPHVDRRGQRDIRLVYVDGPRAAADQAADVALPPGRAAALRELIAIAKGLRSDPDVRPTDEPYHCAVGDFLEGADCDRPGARWVWVEDLGGWVGACDTHSYDCDNCESAFLIPPDWDPEVEAAAAFTATELTDRAVVCDDCWRAMRAAMPDLDERYPGLPHSEPRHQGPSPSRARAPGDPRQETDVQSDLT